MQYFNMSKVSQQISELVVPMLDIYCIRVRQRHFLDTPCICGEHFLAMFSILYIFIYLTYGTSWKILGNVRLCAIIHFFVKFELHDYFHLYIKAI